MDNKNKKWIEKVLQSIPFVKWDRYVEMVESPHHLINFFGWITNKKDSYKDFVDIEFNLEKSEVYFIATSSSKYSKRISKILGSKHFSCKRVEERFEINNM